MVAITAENLAAGWATVLPVEVRFPGTWVKVAGIAGVGTARAFRHKGLFRRVMAEAHRRIVQRGYPAVLLFGIPHLYHKVGYGTTHVDHCIVLRVRELDHLPKRGVLRRLEEEDWPALVELYEGLASRQVGAIRRNIGGSKGFPRGPRWGYGVEGVGVFEGARLLAYGIFDTMPLEALASNMYDLYEVHLSEVMAEDIGAAGLLLEEAARRARKCQSEKIYVHVSPENPIARFLRLFGTEEVTTVPRSGGGMMRVMSPDRLLRHLASAWEQALKAPARTVELPWSGTMEIALSDFPAPGLPASPVAVSITPLGDVEVAPRVSQVSSQRALYADEKRWVSLSITSGALAQLLLGFARLAHLRAAGKANVSGDEDGLCELFEIVAPPTTPFAYHSTHF